MSVILELSNQKISLVLKKSTKDALKVNTPIYLYEMTNLAETP